MKIRLASLVSIIGHPLLTLSVFTIVALFTHEESDRAFMHSLFILTGFFLPVGVKMYVNSKKGIYTNFDVSDRRQRQSWYIFAFLMLLVITLILFLTEQPRALCLAVVWSLVLLTVSLLTNYFIKSSLHVSSTIFLSFLLIPMDRVAGLSLLIFTLPIAWSRVVLGKHTVPEIVAGCVIGLFVGSSYLYWS